MVAIFLHYPAIYVFRHNEACSELDNCSHLQSVEWFSWLLLCSEETMSVLPALIQLLVLEDVFFSVAQMSHKVKWNSDCLNIEFQISHIFSTFIFY